MTTDYQFLSAGSGFGRTAGASGAETILSGVVPAYATWSEDIYFYDSAGVAMDISNLDFYFQFRCDGTSTGADVTLSTVAGDLSIEADGGLVNSILRIDVEPGRFSAIKGDLIADLFAVDGSANVTLYAHGVVTLTNNPVAV